MHGGSTCAHPRHARIRTRQPPSRLSWRIARRRRPSRLGGEHFVQMRQVAWRLGALRPKGRGPRAKFAQPGFTVALGAWPRLKNVLVQQQGACLSLVLGIAAPDNVHRESLAKPRLTAILNDAGAEARQTDAGPNRLVQQRRSLVCRLSRRRQASRSSHQPPLLLRSPTARHCFRAARARP